MARLLGIKASYAIVNRGNPARCLNLSLEQSLFFGANHAIVYIDEDGGYFVDPTNSVSVLFWGQLPKPLWVILRWKKPSVSITVSVPGECPQKFTSRQKVWW